MKKLLLLAACLYSWSLYSLTTSMHALAYENLLLGSTRIDPTKFPEILYIRIGDAACTATVVGSRVILTAAHCIQNSKGLIAAYEGEGVKTDFHNMAQTAKFTAMCYIHPKYPKRLDHDFALCLASVDFPRAATLSKYGIRRGDHVTLAGYGCTNKDGSGGNDGTLRMGRTQVSDVPGGLPGRDIWFETTGVSSLCFGDSGGPALRTIREDEPLEVIGVNSRGDISTKSQLSAVYVTEARKWFFEFEGKYGALICGVSIRCGTEITRPK